MSRIHGLLAKAVLPALISTAAGCGGLSKSTSAAVSPQCDAVMVGLVAAAHINSEAAASGENTPAANNPLGRAQIATVTSCHSVAEWLAGAQRHNGPDQAIYSVTPLQALAAACAIPSPAAQDAPTCQELFRTHPDLK